jgi:hypothetical protein
LSFAQKFLNVMSTAHQLRCDTGISPFWIHPPVECRPRCLIGFYFRISRWPLAALPAPWGVLARRPSQNKTRCFFRHAVHLSLSFAALCTHSLGRLGILPISYPSVYNIYAPYHKRGLMARAFAVL